MSIKENTDKVYAVLKKAEAEMNSAERAFDREGSRIEREASYSTININNMSRAVSMVAAVKRATDELYTSYESIVRMVDVECRLLLEEGIEADAIKKVADFIKKVNEESSGLSSNITGSFNGIGLGDMRSEHYIASLEAKTIEKFWATKYSLTPEAAQEEKNRQARLEKERQLRLERQKQEDERHKAEKAEKDKIAAEKADAEKKLQAEIASEKAKLDKLATEERNKIKELRTKLDKEVEDKKDDLKKEIDSELSKLSKELEQHEKTLASLSFFKMADKKAEKQEIKRLKARILRFQDPLIISSEVNKWKDEADDKYEKFKEDAERKIKTRYTELEKTEKDKKAHIKEKYKIKPSSYSSNSSGLTPTQMVNNHMKDVILEFIIDRGLCSIDDIMEDCAEASDLTAQRISALIRQLVVDGRLQRIEEKRKAYFKVV